MFEVDFAAANASDKLQCLHVDHERPLHLMCAQWSEQLVEAPQIWDDGVDGDLLGHALFGVADSVHGMVCARFRCGPQCDGGWQMIVVCASLVLPHIVISQCV